ncbi:MAG: hypothetical protein ACYTAN_08860 [Planctomycetota bacterium]|jgi:hypothetical protein
MSLHRTITLAAALVLAALLCTAIIAAERELSPEQVADDVSTLIREGAALKAAEKTSDPEILLGLYILSPRRDRAVIREKAIGADPSMEPALLVQEIDWYGEPPDMTAADAFVKADPFNAFAHYVKAYLLERSGEKSRALYEIKLGAGCTRFDTYRERRATAVLQALDALNLHGGERAVAMMYFNLRMNVMSGYYPPDPDLAASSDDKKELAEDLLALAGQVMSFETSDSKARYLAYRATMRAFLLKAQLAEEAGSPQAVAYRAGLDALSEYDWGLDTAVDKAADIPNVLIYVTSRTEKKIGKILATDSSITEEARTELEGVKGRVERLAAEFFAKVASDPDGTIGLWYRYGDLEAMRVMREKHPDIVASAAAFLEERSRGIDAAEEASIVAKAKTRLKIIGLSSLMYASDHEGAFADDLQTLVTKSYCKDPSFITSVVTGDVLEYRGKGRADNDVPSLVLAYEPATLPGGVHAVLRIDGSVHFVTPSELDVLLGSDGKVDEAVIQKYGLSRVYLAELGEACIAYMADNDSAMPADIAALQEGKYLRQRFPAQSPLSGKPYAYPAAGMTIDKERAPETVLFYDDYELSGNRRVVLFGDGRVELVAAAELEGLLRAQGK